MTLRTGTQKQVRNLYQKAMQTEPGDTKKTSTIGTHVLPPYTIPDTPARPKINTADPIEE